MYMPGRLRTASRPFRTLMLSELYSDSAICEISLLLSDAHRHHDVLKILVSRHRHEHAAIGVADRAVHVLRVQVVKHIQQIGNVEADIEGLAVVVDVKLFLGFFLLGVGADDLKAAGADHPAHATKFLVRKYCSPLQRLLEQQAIQDEVLLVVRRYYPRVVGKFSIDDLRNEVDPREAELHLVRQN